MLEKPDPGSGPNGLLLIKEHDHSSSEATWCRVKTGQLSTFLATDYIDLLPHELSCNDPAHLEVSPPDIQVENILSMLAS